MIICNNAGYTTSIISNIIRTSYIPRHRGFQKEMLRILRCLCCEWSCRPHWSLLVVSTHPTNISHGGSSQIYECHVSVHIYKYIYNYIYILHFKPPASLSQHVEFQVASKIIDTRRYRDRRFFFKML